MSRSVTQKPPMTLPPLNPEDCCPQRSARGDRRAVFDGATETHPTARCQEVRVVRTATCWGAPPSRLSGSANHRPFDLGRFVWRDRPARTASWIHPTTRTSTRSRSVPTFRRPVPRAGHRWHIPGRSSSAEAGWFRGGWHGPARRSAHWSRRRPRHTPRRGAAQRSSRHVPITGTCTDHWND